MLIPLGFLASSGGVSSSYELIETYILTGSQTSITFSNLGNYSSVYKHLQLRTAARTDRSNPIDLLRLRFNGDSAANYSWHYLLGNGAVVESGANTNRNDISIDRTGASTGGTNVFGATITEIVDAYSTTKNKTVRSFGGAVASGQTEIWLESGAWRNTNSVTSITILPGIGTNIVAGSRLSLYGIR